MHAEQICVPNGRKLGYFVTSFAENMVVLLFILDFLHVFTAQFCKIYSMYCFRITLNLIQTILKA